MVLLVGIFESTSISSFVSMLVVLNVAALLYNAISYGVKKAFALDSFDLSSYFPSGCLARTGMGAAQEARQEFKILELLLKNAPGRVFSKQNIYDNAWEDYYMGEDKTINVHISNIRKKFKSYTETEYIETVWGVGFRLV